MNSNAYCLAICPVYAWKKAESDDFDGSIMNWVLLSFAVITPMSASIGMAFARREQALVHLAVLKSTRWLAQNNQSVVISSLAPVHLQ